MYEKICTRVFHDIRYTCIHSNARELYPKTHVKICKSYWWQTLVHSVMKSSLIAFILVKHLCNWRDASLLETLTRTELYTYVKDKYCWCCYMYVVKVCNTVTQRRCIMVGFLMTRVLCNIAFDWKMYCVKSCKRYVYIYILYAGKI